MTGSKLWGYSEKVGPVYHNDRDDNMSSKKREEIEGEVRSYVAHFPQSPRFLHFARLSASDVGKMDLGSADSILVFIYSGY